MGRTLALAGVRLGARDFNSLAPCGANQDWLTAMARKTHFNSLAPCGANPRSLAPLGISRGFQLTRPVWGEPALHDPVPKRSKISTHSPRVGRTCRSQSRKTQGRQFQLTRPVWGEPTCVAVISTPGRISTHSPRVGRTRVRLKEPCAHQHFNSLAPCGANPVA